MEQEYNIKKLGKNVSIIDAHISYVVKQLCIHNRFAHFENYFKWLRDEYSLTHNMSLSINNKVFTISIISYNLINSKSVKDNIIHSILIEITKINNIFTVTERYTLLKTIWKNPTSSVSVSVIHDKNRSKQYSII